MQREGAFLIHISQISFNRARLVHGATPSQYTPLCLLREPGPVQCALMTMHSNTTILESPTSLLHDTSESQSISCCMLVDNEVCCQHCLLRPALHGEVNGTCVCTGKLCEAASCLAKLGGALGAKTKFDTAETGPSMY